MAIERNIEHRRALPHLTVKEAAEVLGVGVRSVRNLLNSQKLEARQFCGKTFVTVPSVLRLVTEGVQEGSTKQPTALTASERKTVRELKSGVAS